ncbi:MAG: hypothetical protein ACK46E_04240 [Pseudanabaena sp.]
MVENGINVILIARGAKELTTVARELSLLNPEVNVRSINPFSKVGIVPHQVG